MAEVQRTSELKLAFGAMVAGLTIIQTESLDTAG